MDGVGDARKPLPWDTERDPASAAYIRGLLGDEKNVLRKKLSEQYWKNGMGDDEGYERADEDVKAMDIDVRKGVALTAALAKRSDHHLPGHPRGDPTPYRDSDVPERSRREYSEWRRGKRHVFDVSTSVFDDILRLKRARPPEGGEGVRDPRPADDEPAAE